jgi:signal peptidase I
LANKDLKERQEKRKKRRHAEHKRARSWLRGWGEALIFAIIAALIIRTFFFQAFRIPSSSMEDTLLVGDFLVVSKIAYGARTPMVLGIPFTNIYLPGVKIPWIRLPGLSKVHRYDVVVFNYPIDIAPISAKTDYVKRCVGIPGDTLKVVNSRLFVNGHPAKQFRTLQQQHFQVLMKNNRRLSAAKVQELGGKLLGTMQKGYLVNMTLAQADSMKIWANIQSVSRYVMPMSFKEYSRSVHHFSFSKGWSNPDHMPQIVVPFKGEKVHLTAKNWHIYKAVISRYEHNTVQHKDSTFIINGKPTNTYTIKQNYYFMMGDNRENSEDSRFWGFVPRSHIVGKPVFVYFSWNWKRDLPRLGRIFHIIH